MDRVFSPARGGSSHISSGEGICDWPSLEGTIWHTPPGAGQQVQESAGLSSDPGEHWSFCLFPESQAADIPAVAV